MVAMTLSQSARAWSTSAMWPRCSAPMVGTRPMRAPARRHANEASRNSAMVWMVCKPAAKDSGPSARGALGSVLDPETVLIGGELAAADIFGVGRDGGFDIAGEIGIALDELGREFREQA